MTFQRIRGLALGCALSVQALLAAAQPLPQGNTGIAARYPGDTGIATLKMILVNMKEGGFISEHDYEIGTRIAACLCGGEVTPGSMVDEKWMLDLERHHFCELAKMPKTQVRIAFMLKNGKPLRN